METIAHEMEYKGYALKFYYDDNAEAPREWDNLGTMYCEHRRCTLGDKGAENPFVQDDETGKWKLRDDVAVALPLILLDHSGLAMRTTAFQEDSGGWDSGQVGVIYVTKEKVKEEYGNGPDALEKARKYLEGEVKTYDDYLQGNVYGYVVEDGEGNEIASCWGFYPDEVKGGGWSWEKENQYIIDEAKSAADYDLEQKSKCKQMEAL